MKRGKYPSTTFAGGVVTLFPFASTNKAKPSELVACVKLKICGTVPTPRSTLSRPNLPAPLTLIVESLHVVPFVKVKLLVSELYDTVIPPPTIPVVPSIWFILS